MKIVLARSSCRVGKRERKHEEEEKISDFQNCEKVLMTERSSLWWMFSFGQLKATREQQPRRLYFSHTHGRQDNTLLWRKKLFASPGMAECSTRPYVKTSKYRWSIPKYAIESLRDALYFSPSRCSDEFSKSQPCYTCESRVAASNKRNV